MKDRKLAARYARALLSAFPDPAKSEAVDTFLMAMRQAMTDSTALSAVLVDPAVPRATRIDLLRKTVEHVGDDQVRDPQRRQCGRSRADDHSAFGTTILTSASKTSSTL